MILISAAAFLFLAPGWFDKKLALDPYREWLEHKEEPPVGVIEVWHIVGFRPYVGSIGSWMKERARSYSKRFIGVYFDVKSYSPEDAAEQMSRGNIPDIVSFSEGTFDFEALTAFRLFAGEKEAAMVRAAPFCASGSLIVFEPNAAAGMSEDELKERAASLEDFKKGKAVSCICDIRAAGDLYRAQLIGKCPYFDAAALDEPPLVQYLGITTESDKEKLPYETGFIEFLIGPDAQRSLAGLGIIPVYPPEKPKYEQEWLDELFDKTDLSAIGFVE